MINFLLMLMKYIPFPTLEEKITLSMMCILVGILLDIAIVEGIKSLFKNKEKK